VHLLWFVGRLIIASFTGLAFINGREFVDSICKVKKKINLDISLVLKFLIFKHFYWFPYIKFFFIIGLFIQFYWINILIGF